MGLGGLLAGVWVTLVVCLGLLLVAFGRLTFYVLECYRFVDLCGGCVFDYLGCFGLLGGLDALWVLFAWV